MPRRHLDWLRQAKRKLDSARWNLQGQFFEDACFSSQQAAELAAKAFQEAINHAQRIIDYVDRALSGVQP
jgi:HEPN domain-containing protein